MFVSVPVSVLRGPGTIVPRRLGFDIRPKETNFRMESLLFSFVYVIVVCACMACCVYFFICVFVLVRVSACRPDISWCVVKRRACVVPSYCQVIHLGFVALHMITSCC